jgi:MFS superfamily sulfate permease-like transporter
VVLVGALIFVLGIDLVKEALWDTRNRVNKLEYLTIVSIMITMTVWDFVFGVLFGIVASCELIWKLDGTWTSSDFLRFLLCGSEFPTK